MGGSGGLSVTPGTCGECGAGLPAGRRSYCTDKCQKDGARRKRLWEIFRITPEEYDAILEHQGGVCAICKRPPKPGKRLAVDHDHQTGFIRGLLCFFDNRRVLGARSAEVLIRTAAYVTVPPARIVIGERVAPGRPPKKRRPRKRRTTRSPAARVSL